MANNSIFEFADKFGVNSPFGDWLPPKKEKYPVKAQIKNISISGGNLISSKSSSNPLTKNQIGGSQKPKSSSIQSEYKLLPIVVITNVVDAGKVEVEIDGKTYPTYQFPFGSYTYRANISLALSNASVAFKFFSVQVKINAYDWTAEKIEDTKNKIIHWAEDINPKSINVNYFIENFTRNNNADAVVDLNLRNMLDAINTYFAENTDLKIDKSQIAYIIATVQHESNNTFSCNIIEAYWLSETDRKKYCENMYDPILAMNQVRKDKAREIGNIYPGDGYKYLGRGYSQITGRTLYNRFGTLLDIPLVYQPELALRNDVGAYILLRGMLDGMFTGIRLERYVLGKRKNYIAARATVNGTDQATLIAGYATTIENYIKIE